MQAWNDSNTSLQQGEGKWLATSSDPTTLQCAGWRRKMGRAKKTLRSTFQEELEEMGVSWHRPAGSPVTESDGDFSSPDAPRETGGTKSK